MADSEHEATLAEQSTAAGLSSTLDSSGSARLDVTREELERRQLLHTGQLLKLELAQKNLLLDSLRHEHASVREELQEKLSDAIHERKLLQLRLTAITHAYQQELCGMREKSQASATRKLEEEAGLPMVEVTAEEVIKALHLPLLSEREYSCMKNQDPTSSPLRDYIRVGEGIMPLLYHIARQLLVGHCCFPLSQLRCFEMTQEVRSDTAALQQRLARAEELMSSQQEELSMCQRVG